MDPESTPPARCGKEPQNMPCACGSGKKYKSCCLNDTVTSTMAVSVLRELLTQSRVKDTNSSHYWAFPTTKTQLRKSLDRTKEQVLPLINQWKKLGFLVGNGTNKKPFVWLQTTIHAHLGAQPLENVSASSCAARNSPAAISEAARHTGNIRRLNQDLKVGEISWTSSDEASQVAFLRANACLPGTWEMLEEGSSVEFKPEKQSGKPQPYKALAVKLAGIGRSGPPDARSSVTARRVVKLLKELLLNDNDTGDKEIDAVSSGKTSVDAIGAELSEEVQWKISELFHETQVEYRRKQPSVVSKNNRQMCAESGLFGSLYASGKRDSSVYLNVNEPFCLVTTGVQGSGKSHTVSVVLENCLLPFPVPYTSPIVSLHKPMASLVLHYDQSETNVCEATGLVHVRKDLLKLLMPNTTAEAPNYALSRIVVLVSPTFYRQRKRFYTSAGEKYRVLPLLFRWATLDAVQLKKLMRINESDSQLYVGVMLAKLREYQRAGGVPEFAAFCDEIMSACSENKGQSTPLEQRLMVLRQFVAESKENQELQSQQEDLEALVDGGTLVVADMTDPMLAPAEANGVFQVLLEQFRQKKTDCGKVVVCDEAHKYFDGKSKGGDGLAGAIIDTVRLMRHEGIRVIVSTQSPLTMPPELLELATIAVCHNFHSMDWFKHMSNKLPFSGDGFACVQALEPGEALVFAARSEFASDEHGSRDSDE